MTTSVFIVIRSAGERTLDACRALAAAQAGEGAVQVIEERPFERALQVGFETALDAGRPWTLMLDADVLLRPGAVDRLLGAAAAVPADTLQIKPRVCDKLLRARRPAGVRLYRTAMLEQVIPSIPPPGTRMRPETYLERGFAMKEVDAVVGLHDFEQYYRDIYRKTVVQAHKSHGFGARNLHQWAMNAPDDPDFVVALRGYCDGLVQQAFRGVDVAQYPASITEVFPGGELSEKCPIVPGEWTAERVEETLHIVSPTRRQQLQLCRRQRGWPGVAALLGGRLLQRFARLCNNAALRMTGENGDVHGPTAVATNPNQTAPENTK